MSVEDDDFAASIVFVELPRLYKQRNSCRKMQSCRRFSACRLEAHQTATIEGHDVGAADCASLSQWRKAIRAGWATGWATKLAKRAELDFGGFAGVANKATTRHRRQVFAQANANLAQIDAGTLGGDAGLGKLRVCLEEALFQLGQ